MADTPSAHRNRHQFSAQRDPAPEIVIVGGVDTVKGSSYWSLPSEQQRDNGLSLSRNAVIAAETRAILDLNHGFTLKQMVGTKLDVTALLAPKTRPRCPRCRPPRHPETGGGHLIASSLARGPVSALTRIGWKIGRAHV